jgi:serine/threonine protein kinase
MTACPRTEALRRLLDDELAVGEGRELQAHLEHCPACQQGLERLAAAGPSWDRAAQHLRGNNEPAGPALAQVVERLEATDVTPGNPATVIDTHAEPRLAAGGEFAFLDPPAEPGQLGRLGPYRILRVIGRGGMGVVFEALDERLQRVVAVKVLGPHYANNVSARKRFEREAKAAAAVSHDHVVPIYHVAETRGVSYLVMPRIAGKSLQERIDERSPLELVDVLRIGEQIARGLAAAHRQGLVHRDIKPANILLERVGSGESGVGQATARDARFPTPHSPLPRVKITDFGLARAVDDASVTQSGVITGTPMFMSPEQARGEYTVDARSDLFSLGSVLYIMATGRVPFLASGTHAVIHRVIHDTPRPMGEINPAIPGWFEAIVAKLHAKDAADRFGSADEVADLLAQHLAHLQQPDGVPMPPPMAASVPAAARPARPARNPWARATVIIAGIVCVTVLSIVLFICGLPVALTLIGWFSLPALEHRVGPVGPKPPPEPGPPPVKKEEPWVQLFNGKDLDGWQPLWERETWTVRDGILVGKGQPNQLVTVRDDYKDFHLRVVARINRGGDSGVFIRCQPAKVIPPPGYEVEISGGPGLLATGSVRKIDEREETLDAVRIMHAPADTWFTLEIIARSEHIITRINDQPCAEVTDDTFRSGRIELQVFGANTLVQFKKVEIQEILP